MGKCALFWLDTKVPHQNFPAMDAPNHRSKLSSPTVSALQELGNIVMKIVFKNILRMMYAPQRRKWISEETDALILQ
jgi:hypothetical protein